MKRSLYFLFSCHMIFRITWFQNIFKIIQLNYKQESKTAERTWRGVSIHSNNINNNAQSYHFQNSLSYVLSLDHQTFFYVKCNISCIFTAKCCIIHVGYKGSDFKDLQKAKGVKISKTFSVFYGLEIRVIAETSTISPLGNID